MPAVKSLIKSLLLYAFTARITDMVTGTHQEKWLTSYHQATEPHEHFVNNKTPSFQYLEKLKKIVQHKEIRAYDHNALQKTFPSMIASEGNFLFLRKSRGRLDRMPLSFGKKDTSHLRSVSKYKWGRKTRRRMNRMPLTFGKRVLTEIFKAEVDTSNFAEGYDNSNLYLSGSPEYILPQKPNTFKRKQRSKLDRMPITFGKRLFGDINKHDYENIQESPANNDEEIKYAVEGNGFSRSRKPSLSKVHSLFGRKKKMLNAPRVTDSNVKNYRNAKMAWRSLLALMDQLHPKKAREPPVSSTWEHLTIAQDDVISIGDDEFALNQAHRANGKRQHNLSYENFEQSHGVNVGNFQQQTPVMNRMPSAFGTLRPVQQNDYAGIRIEDIDNDAGIEYVLWSGTQQLQDERIGILNGFDFYQKDALQRDDVSSDADDNADE